MTWELHRILDTAFLTFIRDLTLLAKYVYFLQSSRDVHENKPLNSLN